MTTNVLRDIYDKSGIFTTKKEFEDRNSSIPQSMLYLQAFGNVMNFSFFFFLIFFMIDKHVNLTRV